MSWYQLIYDVLDIKNRLLEDEFVCALSLLNVSPNLMSKKNNKVVVIGKAMPNVQFDLPVLDCG